MGACFGTCKRCSHACGETGSYLTLFVHVLAMAVRFPGVPGGRVRGQRGRLAAPAEAPLPTRVQNPAPLRAAAPLLPLLPTQPPQAIGVLMIWREEVLIILPDSHFVSHTAFGWAVGLGGAAIGVASYGLLSLSPCCVVSPAARMRAPRRRGGAARRGGLRVRSASANPRPLAARCPAASLSQFDGLNHRKLFAIVAVLLAVFMLGAAAITGVWAVDTGGLENQLEFGWHQAFHDIKSPGAKRSRGTRTIRDAQTDLKCCGFATKGQTMAVKPCPSGATQGCSEELVAELQMTLVVLAGMQAGCALVAMLSVGMVACNAEASKAALNRGEAPSGGAISRGARVVRLLGRCAASAAAPPRPLRRLGRCSVPPGRALALAETSRTTSQHDHHGAGHRTPPVGFAIGCSRASTAARLTLVTQVPGLIPPSRPSPAAPLLLAANPPRQPHRCDLPSRDGPLRSGRRPGALAPAPQRRRGLGRARRRWRVPRRALRGVGQLERGGRGRGRAQDGESTPRLQGLSLPQRCSFFAGRRVRLAGPFLASAGPDPFSRPHRRVWFRVRVAGLAVGSACVRVGSSGRRSRAPRCQPSSLQAMACQLVAPTDLLPRPPGSVRPLGAPRTLPETRAAGGHTYSSTVALASSSARASTAASAGVRSSGRATCS